MMAASSGKLFTAEGVASILDTDLYKLTMQCVIQSKFPEIRVTYAFTNRTPHMKLNKSAVAWLREQIRRLGEIALTKEEYDYLAKNCNYLQHGSYLEFLRDFRFRPAEHVHLDYNPENSEYGDLSLSIAGLWKDTILYEIPLLALISEAYFKFCDCDWTHDGQKEKAVSKASRLLERGCIFSEFGTRRRRDYKTQDLVMQGLIDAAEKSHGQAGKLGGTSNVHFAMKYGVAPVGTVAHEWFMGIAAATGDYKTATETALRFWIHCFGRGVLSIALTDTFGTPVFLEAFSKDIPKGSMSTTEGWTEGSIPRYADEFVGVRQDSGDPREFIKTMREFYNRSGITERKTMVFSDALNVDRCFEYKELAEDAGFNPSFGIGTFLTNDFTDSNSKKSEPMNIVIKLSSANDQPAVKLSDDLGKNTGDPDTVQAVKEALGYVEKNWADESSRWSSGG